LRTKSPGLAAVLTVATILVAGCSTAPAASTDDVLVMAQPDAGMTFSTCHNLSYQCQPVYEMLIKATGQVDFAPWLVTEWEYNTDRTVLSLQLRDDVTFTDGERFDAEAVKANLEYIAAGFWGPIFYSKFEAITVTGDFSLDIEIAEPDPILITALSFTTPMVSPAALEDPDALAKSPVGTGPYVLDEANSQADLEYRYTRNDDYWDPDAYPYDEIVVKVLPDATARLNALISGEVDFAEIDPSAADHAKESGFDIFGVAPTWSGLVLGDRTGATSAPLADLRVRQAMSMAFDRKAIVEQLFYGYGIPDNQAFAPSYPEYHAELEDLYSYDPDAARELLAEAGYPDGFDLTIPSYPGQDTYNPIIQQALGDIGIRVTIESMTDEAYGPTIAQGQYPVIFQVSDFIGTAARYSAPNGTTNPWHSEAADPEAAALFAAIAADPDDSDAERSELGRKMVEEAWFVIFGQALTTYGTIPGIDVDVDDDLLYRVIADIRPAD
jgi:peptide/nickel transport system substrate-binding protein